MYENNENDYLKVIQLEGFIQAAKDDMNVVGSLNISLVKYAEFARLVEHHAGRPLTPREWRFIDDRCISEIRRNDYERNCNAHYLYGVAFQFASDNVIYVTFNRKNNVGCYACSTPQQLQRCADLMIMLREHGYTHHEMNNRASSIYYSKIQVEE